MKAAKISMIIGLLIVMVILVSCNPLNEVQENQYKDYDALAAAGEIERGWAPALLPESATNIHLNYDLDDNAVLLAFDFAPTDADALARACQPVTGAPPPRLTASWWPVKVSNASFYNCDDGYLAIQDARAYYWLY